MDQLKSFPEIVGTEKHMLAAIYSKGILHTDIMELYHKIRTGYEQILLNSSQMVELQEVEYHLWKLHYQLIDEFRKRIRQCSFSVENIKNGAPLDNVNSQSNTDKGLEGFKSFLSEATEFYQKLIIEVRTRCGLPAEIFLTNKDSTSYSIESIKMQACQHTCHRLLICLGDLARYTEIVKKSDSCDWSAAAKYYLEATRTWPDSGNPHNQLALLATYVGDAFLALYHCVRSLAVKEPFPDAWRNVMLLFEENRSAKLRGLSSQIQLDLRNLSKRSDLQHSSLHNGEMEGTENPFSENFELWPILVRTISLFLIKSSLEEFPSTLASAVNRLEAMLSVEDTKLAAFLDCYQNINSSRRGPYRAIQLVSVFIFVADHLTESPEREELTEKNHNNHSELTPLAFAAIFICMGRLTERCLSKNRNHTENCPLLPAVVVFVEWLVGALHTIEAYGADEMAKNALSYFFVALAELLDRIGQNGNGGPLDYTALWEDHELRGFNPLNQAHESLDFTTHLECMDDYSSRNQCRSRRLFHAATRIVETAERSCEWIPHDELGRLLKTTESVPDEMINTSSRNEETKMEVTESDSVPCPKKIQPSTEDEEVILFKPITRRNSAPLYISNPTKDPVSPKGVQAQTSVTDEWLRRATSLSTGQNAVDDNDSFSFYTNSGYSRASPSPKQKEPSKDLMTTHPTHPTGPPSLSAWVLSQGSEREPIPSTFTKQKLSPIDEIASTSFSNLVINETKDSKTVAGHTSTIIHEASPFVTPMPSAPLLPDDAAWLRGHSLIPPDYKNGAGNEADGILGAAPVAPMGGYMNRAAVRPPVSFAPPISGLVDGYPPLLGMSSSEWLYHYRNSQNMAGNQLPPIHFNTPTFGNYHSNELSGFDLFDQWGNHLVSNSMPPYPQMYPSSSLVYGAEEPKRDKLFLGYQRPFPYVCGVGVEMNSEQPSLLQYLKEKERQMQPGSQLRNPAYMGNN